MKTLIFLLVFILTIFVLNYSTAQPVTGQALASKVLYYDASGLIGQSVEVLGPLSDSTTRSSNYGRRHVVCFEGVFYQVAMSQKYETGIEKNVFRKSNDGIVWTNNVRAGDAPVGITEATPNVYVWRKNYNIHVGISYIDFRTTYPQIRFMLSTDGGATFQPSIQIGNNITSHDFLYNCGFTGKGDTIVASWAHRLPPTYFSGPTYYTITTDGGTSWLPMGISHPGGNHSKISDVMISQNQTIFIATCQYNGSGKNIEIRSTTNLGTNWLVNTSITNEGSNNSNSHVQLRQFNNKFYAVWSHDFWEGSLTDRIYFSKSTDDGASWETRVRINDSDTIAIWDDDNDGSPTLAFSPNGIIYAVWADSRERYGFYDSAYTHVYISRSTDDGITWSTDLKVSGPSNIPRISNWYPCVNIKSDGVIDTVLVNWSKVRDISIPPITNLGLTVLLEGFYNSGSNSMVGDTMRVFLRNNFSPYNIVDSSIAYLSSDGEAAFTFTNAIEGVEYYISTKHRNALETWSKFPGQSFSSSHLDYDFTTAASQAFGDNMKRVDESPHKFALYSGDVYQDGFIDLSDLSLVYNDASIFATGYLATDINGDNIIDLSDILITYNNSSNFVERKIPQ